jgi:tripartite ATP-independent transporter DctM subunit
METLVTLFGVFLALSLFGVPIAFAMCVGAIVTMLQAGLPMTVLMQRLLFGVDSFPLLAVPLFLLAGELMDLGGITHRIISFADTLLRHVRGGLSHVVVVANMLMSGVSGAGTADAAAVGGILIPAMAKRGYSSSFAAAVVGAAGVLGPIIPPSIAMVVYGAIANVSVGRLFVGGALPGVILGIYMMVVNSILAKKRNYPQDKRATVREIAVSGRAAFFCVIAPFIIIGGIIGGVFTPTEAAAIAVVYSLVVGGLIHHELDWKAFLPAVRRTFLMTANVMFIIAAASSFSWLLARSHAPELVKNMFLRLGGDVYLFLIVSNVLLFILGMLMETTAILLIVVPLLAPLAAQLSLDPVFFGVMMTFNLSIGLVTPPVGMVMFVVCSIAKCDVKDFLRELAPYLVAHVLGLITIIVFPPFVTWLPNLLFGVGK